MNEYREDGVHCGFMVNSAGECTELIASHQMSAAYDILTDAGYSPDKSADIITAAEYGGIDPEKIARKMVNLRKALGDSLGNNPTP